MSGELQAALTALTHRVEALEAARAHGVSRLPASAQTDPRDLSLKARLRCAASHMPLQFGCPHQNTCSGIALYGDTR